MLSKHSKTLLWAVSGRTSLKRVKSARAKLGFGLALCVMLSGGFATSAMALTDQDKQQNILTAVNNHRSSLPAEFVLSIIFQEGGRGAFYVNGYLYNSF